MRKRSLFSFIAISSIALLSSCKKYENNKVPVADAGSPQTVQLPGDSATLQGTGTDKDGTIAGYLWSELSGPNAATIVTDGSATTIVDHLSAGVYIFQLMVVDNEGATGLDTVSVNVLPSKIQTVTLINSAK